jgi:hypothetical protein
MGIPIPRHENGSYINHPYIYARDNPIKYRDPSGEEIGPIILMCIVAAVTCDANDECKHHPIDAARGHLTDLMESTSGLDDQLNDALRGQHPDVGDDANNTTKQTINNVNTILPDIPGLTP